MKRMGPRLVCQSLRISHIQRWRERDPSVHEREEGKTRYPVAYNGRDWEWPETFGAGTAGICCVF